MVVELKVSLSTGHFREVFPVNYLTGTSKTELNYHQVQPIAGGDFESHLPADCLYTWISSGPNTRKQVWEKFTFYQRAISYKILDITNIKVVK